MSETTATRIRKAAKLATLAVAAVGALVAAALLWRTDVPAGLALPEVEPEREFSSGHLRETAGYASFLRWTWAAGSAAQLAALAVLALAGPRLARRLRGPALARGFALVLVALAVAWLARFPFAVAAHRRRRQHGVSRDGFLEWLAARWLEQLGTAVAASVAVAAAMLLARRLGERWWLAGAPLLAVVGAGVVLVQPLLLAPRLDPLADRRLAAEIRALAREVGVGRVDVDVRDAATRTRRANAEVIGLGPTRRVVLWDTLLDGRYGRGEIRFVVAHELAHAARAHVWKGLAWFGLLCLPAAYVVAAAARRRGGMSEPGAVPAAVLAVVALELALLPAANAISRRYEAEADWVALEATREPAAAERVFRGFSLTGLSQPRAPTWAYVALATHPSLVERIAMARAWRVTRASRAGSGSPRSSTTSTTRPPSRRSARA